jgi:HTH-type transcriptional regulator/antitoxin HipB
LLLSPFDDMGKSRRMATEAARVRLRTAKELGLVIRERRKALALGQQALAARVGVSRQWVVEIERGKARAELGLVLRTLTALGLTLLVETDGPPPGGVAAERPLIHIDAIVERARGKPSR